MRLDNLLGGLMDAVTGRGQQQDEDQYQGQPVRPATEDPWGDPADGQNAQNAQYPGGVLPASQDPYGDPADTYQGQQVM